MDKPDTQGLIEDPSHPDFQFEVKDSRGYAWWALISDDGDKPVVADWVCEPEGRG